MACIMAYDEPMSLLSVEFQTGSVAFNFTNEVERIVGAIHRFRVRSKVATNFSWGGRRASIMGP